MVFRRRFKRSARSVRIARPRTFRKARTRPERPMQSAGQRAIEQSNYKAVLTPGYNMTGCAPQGYAKLKYTETINRTSTAGSDAFYVWSVNDIFDPNVTGTGAQPLGRDQWANFFNGYRVMGCKATISAKGTAIAPWLVAWGPIPLVSGPGSTDVACQTKGWKWKVIDGVNDELRLTTYVKPWVSLGITKERYSSDDIYSAAMGSSPSNRTCMEIACRTMDASTSTLYFMVELVYYVRFVSPVVLAAS